MNLAASLTTSIPVEFMGLVKVSIRIGTSALSQLKVRVVDEATSPATRPFRKDSLPRPFPVTRKLSADRALALDLRSFGTFPPETNGDART